VADSFRPIPVCHFISVHGVMRIDESQAIALRQLLP